MAPPIFKDPLMQTAFDKQGFVVAKFLDDADVAFLNTEFDKLHPSLPATGGFVSGSYSNDFEYKKKASNLIVSVFSRHFERLFTDYQTFGAAFLYKLPSEGSELGVHQDWTIVDEESHVALNCWVPLTDIDETNGALHVMPGSQYTKFKTLRAPTVPFFFSGSEREVIDRTVPFYVKAGEAVILNQSVIHFSPPNRSGAIRKAITAGVKTKDAAMLFHFKNEEGKVERYHMPENFLIAFENFASSIFEKPSTGKLISVSDYNDPILETINLMPLLDKLKTQAGYMAAAPTFFDKLFSKIKRA